MRRDRTEKISIFCVVTFFLFLVVAAWIENVEIEEYDGERFWNRIFYTCHKDITYSAFPIFGYANVGMWEAESSIDEAVFCEEVPLFGLIKENISLEEVNEDSATLSALMCMESGQIEKIAENTEGVVNTSEFYSEMMNENRHAVLFTNDTDFFTEGSGFISEISTAWVTEFIKATEKSVEFDRNKLTDYEFVMENFYIVDSCTSAGPDIIKPEQFLAYDATIDTSMPGPHILIYHTHSQEGFADSIPGDKSTTIVGAGAKLAELLREEYGYEVYHHTGEYDLTTRDDAYARSAPALEEILAQYPQIQVIIDLHRDGVDESRHLVTEWEGREVAQFMFFNGLSYLNTKGAVDYLANPNLQGNLALSYQATVTANEYYPGLARRNYLNGYRYNMHYREKTLLIELGAQTNTVDEIMSACEPLAHILDMVFSGEENS